MDIGFRHMIPCSAVQGMGSGLLFCTDSHNKYVMPILNGTFLCFLKCVHTWARISKSLQLYNFTLFYTLQVYNYFYLIFTILCDDDVVLFVYM